MNTVNEMAKNIWPLYRSKAVMDACRLYYRVTERIPYTLEGALFLALRGLVLQWLGKYRGAEANLRRALAIRRGLLPEHHPHIATNLGNIGDVLYEQNSLDEALEHYRRALAIFEKSLGANHPHTNTARNKYRALREQMDYTQEPSSFKN